VRICRLALLVAGFELCDFALYVVHEKLVTRSLVIIAFSLFSRAEKFELLPGVLGGMSHGKELATLLLATLVGTSNYALTFYYILKMFPIYFHVKSRIPVVCLFI